MQWTSCKIERVRRERLRVSRVFRGYVLAGMIAVNAAVLGCAHETLVLVRPDPPPVPSDMALVQLDAMAENGCLATGDAMVEYLAEVEDYFDYLSVLRGDEPEVPDSPWWMFWDSD